MRLSSLTARLLLSAGAWSVLVLALTGLLLSSLFRSAVERSFDDRLDVFVKSLIAELNVADDGSLTISRDLPEPRFNFPLSGWYWEIAVAGEGKASPLGSPSLLDQRLDLSAIGGLNADATTADYLTGPDGEILRVLVRQIRFSAREAPLMFTVAGDAGEIDAAARDFNETLFLSLSILGLGLLVSAFLQVRYGLSPVRALRRSVAEIRAGRQKRLTGDYPSEISPLAEEVNLLLDTNEEVIERARTHVGNLAHALKTPLSVLRNEAGGLDGALAGKVEEQVSIMREQVDRHLERARVAARANVLGASTDVAPVLSSIVHALEKINSDKAIDAKVDCPLSARFRGEKQDLEEMVGNLLDNAFKWARAKIIIEVNIVRSSDDAAFLSISIEDDGPGLTEDERAAALQRGQRLDESKPGSGLGLSIVADIALMYKGTFELDDGRIGGLRTRLQLPALA
ncbi:Sensor histidine kinase [hydrothermal vent metagenome]|uniref:histidine kinase n=1 Tax=hydrothermal vent metagenome TaxID=652676 RepID=A0A3B0TUQ2_9ZZZZ